MIPIALGYLNPGIEFLADGSPDADAFLDPRTPDHPARQIDLRQMRRGGVRFAVLSVANPDPARLPGSAGVEYVARMLAALRDGFDRHAAHCRPALCSEDLAPARFRRDERVTFLLHLTGAPLNGALQNLSLYRRLGVRAIHPFCDDPAIGGFSGWGETRRGLTRYGKDLLREAQRLGLVVDLAHANDRTFREALRCVTGPVINSHSNPRALRDIDRNSTDAQIRAIAERGGVIGVHFSSSFLHEPGARARAQRQTAIRRAETVVARLERRHKKTASFLHHRFDGQLFDEAAGGLIRREPLERAPLERLVEHVLHLLEVAGEDHVGLGPDYTLGDLCGGVTRAEHLPRLLRALAARGLTPLQIRKIAWDNWLRVYRHGLPSGLANTPAPNFNSPSQP